MAAVNKILLPRRAKKSVMQTPGKSSIILEKGELFVECSEEGIGYGHALIKIGNGVSAYSDLDYAIGDTSNDAIVFSESSASNITNAINKLKTGTKLSILIANIKKCIVIFKTNNDNINTKFSNLTDSDKITEVKVVTSLPADASAHPTTLYLIKSS